MDPTPAVPAPVSPGKKWQQHIGDALCCTGLAILCLAFALPRFRLGIDLSDEGFLAYGAVRVLEGQLPHRDFFSLQPPFSFYSLAAAFKLFGTSLASLRFLGLGIYCGIGLTVYGICRQRAGCLPSLAAAVPALLLGMPYFNFVPFAVWQGLLFSLLATFFLLRGTLGGKPAWGWGAGAATALAIVSRHDVGCYLTLSVLCYFLVLRLSRLPELLGTLGRLARAWSLGAAIPLALLAALWWIAGAVPAMFRQLVLFPLTTYAKTSSLPMPSLSSVASLDEAVSVAFFYLPVLLDVSVASWLVLVFLRRRWRAQHAHLAFLLVLSLLCYCQVLTRSDLRHLLITLPPHLALGAWSASGLAVFLRNPPAPGPSRMAAWAVRCFLALVLLLEVLVLLAVAPQLSQSPRQPSAPLSLERGGVLLPPPLAADLEQAVETMQSAAGPGRSVLALPYIPMFYFLSQRRNPTRWNYLWNGDQSEQDHRDLVAQVMQDPPAVVAIGTDVSLGLCPPTVMRFLASGFRPGPRFGTVQLLLPATGAPR